MAKKTKNSKAQNPDKQKKPKKAVSPLKTRFDRLKKWPGKNIGLFFRTGLIILGPIMVAFYLIWPVTKPKTPLQNAQQSLVQNPTDIEAQLILIEKLLENNQLEAAKNELEKIQNFQSFNEKGPKVYEKIETLRGCN